MQHLTVQTEIAAPPERCFLLSLSIDLHQESASGTQERAIAGVTHGIIGPGQTVKWKGRHFGLMLTHESVISSYNRPRHFQDRMIHGAFKTFVHDHFFEETPTGTRMRDELTFEAPFGLLGRVVERLLLRQHMLMFLRQRNEVIRLIAEGNESKWGRYLTAASVS